MRRLIAALLIAPTIAAAQSARLTIRVESDGNPVVQAQVMSGIDITATNAAGTARLMLNPGTHVVRVRLNGFSPDSFRVTLARGADTTVRFELQPVTAGQGQFFVSSARGVRRMVDDPVRVEVLGHDEIERKTEMRPQDLKGVFDLVPGARVQPTSAATGAAGIRLQGMKPRYSLLLADGLPLYGNGGSGLDLLQIPAADLEQIEVIKGPATPIHGSNSLAGVVNLISKRPGNENEVLANANSLGGGNAFGWTSRRVSDRFGYTTLVGGHTQSARDGDDDTWLDQPEVMRFEVRPRLFFDSPNGSSSFLTFGATIEDRKGGFENETAPDASSYAERAKTRRGDVGLTMKRVAGASSVVQLRGSFNLNAVDHEFGEVTEQSTRSTGFGELSYSFTDQFNQFLVGAAVEADIAQVKGPSASSAAGTPVDYTWITPSLFLQNAFVVTDQVSVTATARGDMHSKYGTFFSPRLSILIKPAERWSLRFAGSRGFFAPTPFIEEVEPVGAHRVNGFESGAPRAVGAETAEYGSADLHGVFGRLDLNAAAFLSVTHRPVVVIPAAGGRYSFASSENAHSSRGLELRGVYDLRPVSITGLYTYTDARERASITSETEAAASYSPRHTGGLDIAWQDERRGSRISLQSLFTSRQLLLNDPALDVGDPYALVGLSLSQKVGRFTIFAGLENLTDVRQTNFAPVVLPQRETDGRWTVTPWAPLEGRTFSVGGRIRGFRE